MIIRKLVLAKGENPNNEHFSCDMRWKVDKTTSSLQISRERKGKNKLNINKPCLYYSLSILDTGYFRIHLL